MRLSRLTAYYTASWTLPAPGQRAAACSSSLDLLAESAEGLEALVTDDEHSTMSLDVRVGPTGGSIDLKPKAQSGWLVVGTLVGQTGPFNWVTFGLPGGSRPRPAWFTWRKVVCGCARATGSDAGTAWACRFGRTSPGVMCNPVMWSAVKPE